MKVKLKKGESLSMDFNYNDLLYLDWVKLNQGKSVELKAIPKLNKEKFEIEEKKRSGK
tara:strand:- start:451 stop:624 length:174 start_codon:yes stop_codon:yes gene_type:complete